MNDYDIVALLGEQCAYLMDPNDSHGAPEAIRSLVQSLLNRERCPPIDMLLYCPACGMQHIDEPEGEGDDGATTRRENVWRNPPHRSHLCHGCGHIWRPADVPTNGVAALQTKGKNDSPFRPSPMSQPNRLIAYSACDMLRASGYSWNDKLKVWTK